MTLGWPERLVLATSVWLAYTADRWIEAWRLDHAMVRTPRHLFHQRWRWPVALVATVALAVDLATALTYLTPGDIVAGSMLVAAVLAYLLSHQWLHRHARWRLPKEICVAILLTLGVWLFVRQASGASLWLPLGLFSLLCLTNCALISRWEVDVDRHHGQTSIALDVPGGTRIIGWLPWITMTAAVAAVVAGPVTTITPATCAALTALLLAWIDRVEPRIGWPRARLMSDMALLTPLVAAIGS